MIEWDTTNLPIKNIFGLTKAYVDNAKKTTFDSGRDVSFQKNSKNKMKFSFSYRATKTQETAFFNWYENTLGGNANHFTAPSLRGDNTTVEYKFDGTPSSSGQAYRQIDMVWVEV